MEEMAAKKKAAADLRKSLEEYKRSGRFTVPDRVNHIRKLQKVDGVEIYAVQYTTIQRAAQTSDVAGIRYFVAKGMLNDADEMGNTALHEGARFGYQNIVRELCAQGCDVNTRNNIGQTPAHLATAGGHGDLLELIYDKGGDLTLPDAGGSTCAHYAAQVNRVDILETLYRLQDFPLGPEVLSIASKNGITPAHIAAGFDCLEALDFLYRHGCALDPRDVTGEMPCHKAARGGHNRTLRGLKKINMDFGVANVDEDSTNDIVDDKSRFWKEGGGESMKSLRELAKMRRDGKLSHREFQRMKMAELDQPGAGLNMAAEQEVRLHPPPQHQELLLPAIPGTGGGGGGKGMRGRGGRGGGGAMVVAGGRGRGR